MSGMIWKRSGDRLWGKDTGCWAAPMAVSSPPCILQRQPHLNSPAWSGDEKDRWKAKDSRSAQILANIIKRTDESCVWLCMSSTKSPQRAESRAGDTEGIPKGQEKVLVRKALGNKPLERTRVFRAAEKSEKGRTTSFKEVLGRGAKAKER